MRDFSKKFTKPDEMDMKKIPKPRMEEFERRQRREREKYERHQQVQSVDREHSLFSEPRRINPSEVDDVITPILGEYAQAKEFINLYTVGISNSGHRPVPLAGIVPNSVSCGGQSGGGVGIGGNMSLSASSASQRLTLPSSQQQQQQQQQAPPPHHYQQQQSRQQPYVKQTDNKPPYNGRGGYPGQPVKNDLRSSSGMAPPKGPPPMLSSSSSNSSSASSSLLQPPSSTLMPNGRQSASDKLFPGPPSSTTHNGRFPQPSIPKNRQKLLTEPENDIKQIINEMTVTFRGPAAPLTQIAATPHTTINENYNLNGPNKHKYGPLTAIAPLALEPLITPIQPLASPPLMAMPMPVHQSSLVAPISAINSIAPPRPKEQLPPKPLKTEKVAPALEKQNSTLENDLELSESDDDRKKQNSRSVINSSESSLSDSSESGSEESSKGDQRRQQQEGEQQHLQQPHHLIHQQQTLRQSSNASGAGAVVANSTGAVASKKKLSQTITAGGSNTISSLLNSSGLGSAGSSSSGPSSTSSSNKTPSPSDNSKWNLSRYFNKAATQQTQNDASPSSVVNSMNVSMNVPTMLPGGAQIIPEPTPQQLAAAAAAAAAVASQPSTTIVKSEEDYEDEEDDDDDDDDDDDEDEDCDAKRAAVTVPSGGDTFRQPAFVARKPPQGLSVPPLMKDIKKESDALFPNALMMRGGSGGASSNATVGGQQVPLLNEAECVAIPTSQIKHEAAAAMAIASGATTVTAFGKRSPKASPHVNASAGVPSNDKLLAPELRKEADEYMRYVGSGSLLLSGLSSDSDSEAVTVPMPGPGGTLKIPGVPAAITAMPRSPPTLHHKPPTLPNSVTVTPIAPLPPSPKSMVQQRAKKPRKKLKQPPPVPALCDSSDEEEGEYNSSSAAVSPAAAIGAKVNAANDNGMSAGVVAATKKGRGRPRKNTPSQSGNISSASSTTAKGPTLTAKKDVAKKTAVRRRMSRQNSSSASTSALDITPTKVNTKTKVQPVAVPLPLPLPPQLQAPAPVPTVAAPTVANASSEDSSSSSSSSYSTSKSSSSSSDSEAGGCASSSTEERKRRAAAAMAKPAAGRVIVKQLKTVASAHPPTAKAAKKARTQFPHNDKVKDVSSSSSSSEDSSAEDYVQTHHPANDFAMTTAAMPSAPQSGSGSHRSQNQQSPFKAARSSRSRVSTSCSSASSSSSGEEQSDSDCDVGRKKKHRRDKPRSDKNKTNTLIRIFNPKEGGAKKQGQVVIIDQSEEMLSKEQHHLQQQQQQQQQQQFHHQQQTQQKHISPNAAFKTSQENLAQLSSSSSASTTAPPPTSAATVTTHSSQSPRLTPGSMKSPRNLLPSQLLAHRTPDRSSSSAERKLHQRIKTPTRTPARTPPTTRTPTPTQQHMPGMASSALRSGTTTPTAAGSSLICKIDLSRLKRIAPEWHTNSYRLYTPGGVTPTAYHHHTGAGPPSGRTPIYDHETILNADLQATQLRLKPSSRSGSTPRSTGSRTPTQAAVAAAAAAAAASDREMSRSRESLLDGGSSKQRLEDVHSNGRLSSRSTDGASTPKDLPQASAHLTPNGYTSSRGLSAAGGAGSGSPSTKLMTGVKHEHIKYEPDADAYNDTKFKTSSGGGSGGGAAVKQELLIMKHDLKPSELAGLAEKNRIGSPATGEMKPRRKRSSSSSSSPYKEKKRKKEKDSAGGGSASATAAAKDKEKDKADRDGNKSAADRLMTNNGPTQREMLLLDQQLPPTNHDRLLDKQTLHNVVASSSPAHLQHPTTANATMPPPTSAAALAAALPLHHELMTPPTHTTPLGLAVAGADGMITPPRPAPQVIYRSYFERDDDSSEDFSKNAKFLQAAVSRKRAADKEANSFSQVTLYLEAVVYFLLSGAAMEQHRGSEEAAWILYKDTLALIKFISSKFKHLQESSSNGQHETHNKVAILSLRCQSLISLKLYKMKRAFCRSITTVCSNFFKSGKGEIVNGNTPSSISPSNSVCSQGSGSNTPPGKIVPQDIHSALHQQNQYFSYITSSHELWDQADRLVRQGNHTDFFIALDHENGPLTLHSSMHEVFRYVQAGLKKLRDAMSIQ